MHKNTLISLSLFAAVTLAAAGYTDTYYKWVDDQNITHYGKRPPADRESTEVHTSGLRSAPAPAPSTSAKEEAGKPGNIKTAEGKLIKDPEVCKRARTNLKTLQESALIRQKDEYGDVRVLSEEEKASEINRAKDAIKLNC